MSGQSNTARARAHAKHPGYCSCGRVVWGNGGKSQHKWMHEQRHDGHGFISKEQWRVIAATLPPVVKLFGIGKGDAGVKVDDVYIGDATHTDEGTWWSALRVGNGDRDILDDHRTRREAVERLVQEYAKRREQA